MRALKTSTTSRIAFFLVLSLLAGFAAAQPPWDGSGSEGDPYQIWDANDVNAMGEASAYYSAHFKLMANIDLSGFSYTKAVIASDVITGYPFDGISFTGVFDGNGYVIKNLVINSGAGNYYLGLFGQIGYAGTIKNLRVANVSITGGPLSAYIGGLVGWNDMGNVSRCYVNCSETGWDSASVIGGLVGINYDGEITNCYSTGLVIGSSTVGGLVGSNSGGTISKCYSSSAVFGNFSVGGLVGGIVANGIIRKCYSTGPVLGESKVGGLVGHNKGRFPAQVTISECYSHGAVFGYDYVGGLVGYNEGDFGAPVTVSQCYSTGAVSGVDYVGGLVGNNYFGTAIQCYWDKWTSGRVGSHGGTRKTTFEMKQEATYTGWDFVDVWYIIEDVTYPILSWTPTFYKGDLNLDGHVNFLDLVIIANHWLE
jgi:hypothetical protein